MNEPFKREYGYLYIVSPEEKKAAEPKRATDEWHVERAGGWIPVNDVNKAANFCLGLHYRRPVDPDPEKPEGQKRWEIVPESELDYVPKDCEFQFFEARGWFDLYTNGKSLRFWLSYDNLPFKIIAFRRPISAKNEKRFLAVNILSLITKSEAEAACAASLKSRPDQQFSVVESTGQIFKAEKSEAELAWDEYLKKFPFKIYGEYKSLFIEFHNFLNAAKEGR